VLLLFTIAIVGIIAPVEAKLNAEAYSSVYLIEGKSGVSLSISSNIGDKKTFDSSKNQAARKKEINNVNKMVISIKGYKAITFKKPKKGWKMEYKNYYTHKYFSVKGKAAEKNYSIKFYNKKGKLIKNIKGKINGLHDLIVED
jgi:hypothetical protein